MGIETSHQPAASILIPTKNAGPEFGRILEAIRSQRTDQAFEVIVVDSGSRDGTLEHAVAAGVKLHQIAPEEFGHGRTRNLLGRLARGQRLVFLTQDAMPADDLWLARLLGPLSLPGVAACFGRQVPRRQASLLQVHHLIWWYPNDAGTRSFEKSADARIQRLFYSHVNAACRRDVWHEFPFDETVVMSEDQEWSRRVLLAGWKIVYEPSAAVIHSHEDGLGKAFRRHFDSGASLSTITADSEAGWFGHGLRYLASELRFLVARRRLRLVPYALVYEATRYLGFLLGRQSRWLPFPIKSRFGEHRQQWLAARREMAIRVSRPAGR